VWAESDSRRRGRGRPAPRADAPKREEPKREPAKREAPRERSRPERPRPAATPAAEAPRAPAARPERAPGREDHRPREPRHRDDDLGAAVRGFGDDMPDFMRQAARPRREPVPQEPETTES
jgi:hypothetical protein